MTKPKTQTKAAIRAASIARAEAKAAAAIRAEAVERDRLEAERLARIERDRIDALEMDQLDAHVNITQMTRDQMAAFAMRTYGVRVDASALKADVTSSVRNLMMSRSGGRHV